MSLTEDEMRQCEAGGCTKGATRIRKSWRFGRKEEKPIVKFNVYLCEEHSKAWDENVQDAEAEARAS